MGNDTMENDMKPRPNFALWILAVLVIIMTINLIISLLQPGNGYLAQTEPTTSSTETQPEDTLPVMFHLERIGRDNRFEFYRDSVTDILYLRPIGGSDSGITTMLDPETGLPLTYARYMEFYNRHLNEAK